MSTAKRSASHGRHAVGHPIDVATGVLFHDLKDCAIPGRMPLIFARRYSSALAGQTRVGMFGPSWACPFEARLQRDLGGYSMVAPDGETRISFDDSPGVVGQGGTVANLSAGHELAQDAGTLLVTRWSLHTHDVERFRFEKTADPDSYRLCSQESTGGQAIEILYDGHGRIVKLRQRREGRAFLLRYDLRGRVIEVRVSGRAGSAGSAPAAERLLWSYRYDEAGRLSEAVDALGQRSAYDYDEAGRLIRELTPAGMVYHFRYDAAGRCVESVGRDGFAKTTLRFDPRGRRTEVCNSLDHVTTYLWNEHGQVEQEISPLGNKKRTVYDEHGRMVRRIRPSGAAMVWQYDARGDLCAVTVPTGATTRFEHDGRHLLVALTDAAGFRWERSFDDRGRLCWVQAPDGRRTTFTYGRSGDLLERQSPLGHRQIYDWDADGNLRSLRDAKGHATYYEYDSEGRLSAVTTPGHGSDLAGARTEFRRDALGQVREMRLPDGATRRFAYHPTGQLTHYIDENRNLTRWRYLPCGILIEQQKPLGARLKYRFGTEPTQLQAVVNEVGAEHVFEYDAEGRLVAEIDFGSRRSTYDYDGDGHLISMINAAGQRTTLVRDPCGALLEATYFDGTRLKLDYDARGLLVAADSGDAIVKREYDALGRLVWEKQGAHEVCSEYDADGRRIRRGSSLGYAAEFDFDANDQLLSLRQTVREEQQAAIFFDYAPSGSELRRFLQIGTSIEVQYDLRGRWSRQHSGQLSGRRTDNGRRFSYDAAGRLLGVFDDRFGQTRYGYDVNGRVTSRSDFGLGAASDSRLHGGDFFESFVYDPAGNLLSAAELRIDPVSRLPRPEHRQWSHGPGNQPQRVGDTLYEYDVLGQCIRRSDPQGTTGYVWNAQGLLVRVVLPDGTPWDYCYDAFARRTEKRSPGTHTRFIWDGDVLLHEVRQADTPVQEVVHLEFEPGGFVPLCKWERGEQYLFVNDENGTPRELLAASGRTVWAALLSTYGRVQAEFQDGSRIDCPIRFQGQWHDAETGLYYNRFRYFSAESGGYLSLDPILFQLEGVANGYAYPRNPLSLIDPFGLIHTLLHTSEIHAMQSSCRNKYRDYDETGYTVRGNAAQLQAGTLDHNLLRIDVFRDENGKLWAINHRRLTAFWLVHHVGLIPVNLLSVHEVGQSRRRKQMTTTNGGVSIELKMNGEGENEIVKKPC